MFGYFKNLKEQWQVKEEEWRAIKQLNQIIEREEKLYSANSAFCNNTYYGKHYSFKDHLNRMEKAKEVREKIYSNINKRRQKALFPFLPETSFQKYHRRKVGVGFKNVHYQDDDNER